MSPYQKPAELYDGLRLHQNEHTGGCSPRVLRALASLTPEQLGFYPPYEAATSACARYLGVDPDRLTLVNGLDEGIMAVSVAHLRPSPDGFVPEAIIPEPAFEIFGFDTEVAGGIWAVVCLALASVDIPFGIIVLKFYDFLRYSRDPDHPFLFRFLSILLLDSPAIAGLVCCLWAVIRRRHSSARNKKNGIYYVAICMCIFMIIIGRLLSIE